MHTRTTPTYLFVVRLWREDAQPPQTGWRGSITFAATGETRHFRDVAALAAALQRLLADQPAGDEPSPG